MDMDESMADDHLEIFPTLILETLVVASENQFETKETEVGGKKKKSRLVSTRKRPSKCSTMDDKGQVDLKGVSNDEIPTKKDSSNGKNVNTNARLYDERRI